jgi:hypothetical protein
MGKDGQAEPLTACLYYFFLQAFHHFTARFPRTVRLKATKNSHANSVDIMMPEYGSTSRADAAASEGGISSIWQRIRQEGRLQ